MFSYIDGINLLAITTSANVLMSVCGYVKCIKIKGVARVISKYIKVCRKEENTCKRFLFNHKFIWHLVIEAIRKSRFFWVFISAVIGFLVWIFFSYLEIYLPKWFIEVLTHYLLILNLHTLFFKFSNKNFKNCWEIFNSDILGDVILEDSEIGILIASMIVVRVCLRVVWDFFVDIFTSSHKK